MSLRFALSEKIVVELNIQLVGKIDKKIETWNLTQNEYFRIKMSRCLYYVNIQILNYSNNIQNHILQFSNTLYVRTDYE